MPDDSLRQAGAHQLGKVTKAVLLREVAAPFSSRRKVVFDGMDYHSNVAVAEEREWRPLKLESLQGPKPHVVEASQIDSVFKSQPLYERGVNKDEHVANRETGLVHITSHRVEDWGWFTR